MLIGKRKEEYSVSRLSKANEKLKHEENILFHCQLSVEVISYRAKLVEISYDVWG